MINQFWIPYKAPQMDIYPAYLRVLAINELNAIEAAREFLRTKYPDFKIEVSKIVSYERK